jgi:hypothetical protein
MRQTSKDQQTPCRARFGEEDVALQYNLRLLLTAFASGAAADADDGTQSRHLGITIDGRPLRPSDALAAPQMFTPPMPPVITGEPREPV